MALSTLLFYLSSLLLLSSTLVLLGLPNTVDYKLFSLKDKLYKSIISQALSQQEDLPSTGDKDKEMAAAYVYCKLLFQVY